MLVGIAGGVAVGKSTLAARLAEALLPMITEVVATDGFLRPNAELATEGSLLQKGFPSTYDTAAMTRFLRELRSGGAAAVPVYSHATYDIVPGEVRVVDGADVVLLEGVNALQADVAPLLDLRIYLDADEPVVRRWYIERFLGLIHAANDDPSSFYRRFLDLDDEGRRAMAVAVWEGVNLVNLNHHILPTREAADVVADKAADHTLTLGAGTLDAGRRQKGRIGQ